MSFRARTLTVILSKTRASARFARRANSRQFSADGDAAAAINPDGNEIGLHPETGEMIYLKTGRFGPYVEMANGEKPKRASLTKAEKEKPEDLTLDRAVALIEDKKANPGRGRGGATPLKELGKHADGEPVQVFAGRYGPYVKHGKVNATIPKEMAPETITLEQAVELVNARAAAGPAKKKAPAKKPAAKKKPAARKKPAAKKAD